MCGLTPLRLYIKIMRRNSILLNLASKDSKKLGNEGVDKVGSADDNLPDRSDTQGRKTNTADQNVNDSDRRDGSVRKPGRVRKQSNRVRKKRPTDPSTTGKTKKASQTQESLDEERRVSEPLNLGIENRSSLFQFESLYGNVVEHCVDSHPSVDMAFLASIQDFPLSSGEEDDGYHSSEEEREEVAWLARKISTSSSGIPHIDLFVDDPTGINLMVDWDGAFRLENAVFKI
ncbi:hypothetical protein NE237_023814 [Protea cynaroides]|uniref:Uncharacterized protein n=1 Tax=Protea cynaroides TaxID=273540 RepID=A0A9Q0K6E8_9MAGN|nr:hypothetical protein NE237_023814 [Protea cynaroides]